jgi:hypothetical protein
MSRSNASQQQTMVVAGLATAAAVSLLYYYWFTQETSLVENKTKKLSDDDDTAKPSISSRGGVGSTDTGTRISTVTTPLKETAQQPSDPMDKTPQTKNSKKDENKNLHAEIEELDKKGKALFKNKQVRTYT